MSSMPVKRTGSSSSTGSGDGSVDDGSKSPKKKSKASKIKRERSDYVFVNPEPTCWEKTQAMCCQKSLDTDIDLDAELRTLLQETQETKNYTTESIDETHAPRRKFKAAATDGCTEKGVLRQPKLPKAKPTAMSKLRKGCQATRGLPDPEVAISNTNLRITAKNAVKPARSVAQGSDRGVLEINQMLKRRLSGNINLGDPVGEYTEEKGEALRTPPPVTDRLQIPEQYVSHLTDDSDLSHMSSKTDTGTQGRRGSYISRHSIHADTSRRRSSVHPRRQSSRGRSLSRAYSQGDLLGEEWSPYDEENRKMDERTDRDFIDHLPEASSIIKNDLQKDWSYTKSYVKTLGKIFKGSGTNLRNKMTEATERWMCTFYVTSDIWDDFTDFHCLLVRLILQHHCVAYDERDVALNVKGFQQQLEERLEGKNVSVPFVFSFGVPIGNCQVIFAIHKLKMMKQIFGKYMMSAEKYSQWLSNKHKTKSPPLSVGVKLSKYPALRILVHAASGIRLTTQEAKDVQTGQRVIRYGRERWAELSKELLFKQPDLERFVMLKNTILLAMNIMNGIYFKYLVKVKKA